VDWSSLARPDQSIAVGQWRLETGVLETGRIMAEIMPVLLNFQRARTCKYERLILRCRSKKKRIGFIVSWLQNTTGRNTVLGTVGR